MARRSDITVEEAEGALAMFQLFGYPVQGPPPLPPPLPGTPEYLEDLEDDADEEYRTPEEKELYHKQVSESDGFDVGLFTHTGVTEIWPMDLTQYHRYINFQWAAELAIKSYNSRYKDKGELQFVKAVKCMRQISCFLNYYLTFEARDLSNDQVQTYQALLYEDDGIRMAVLSFRLKPCEGEGGVGNCQNNWFWRRHSLEVCPGGFRFSQVKIKKSHEAPEDVFTPGEFDINLLLRS